MDSLEALDSASPMNTKNLMNFFQHAGTSGKESGNIIAKKRGTLNSSVNLYTFVKILEETAKVYERDSIGIVPENMLRFVKKYRLKVNAFKADNGAKSVTTSTDATINATSTDDEDDGRETQVSRQ